MVAGDRVIILSKLLLMRTGKDSKGQQRWLYLWFGLYSDISPGPMFLFSFFPVSSSISRSQIIVFIWYQPNSLTAD